MKRVIAAALLLSCAPSPGDSNHESLAASRVLPALESVAAVADAVRARAALVTRTDGVHLQDGSAPIDVRLPGSTVQALRIALRDDPSFWLEVEDLAAAPATFATIDRARVAQEPTGDTVVQIADRVRAEELRVVSRPRPRDARRYRLQVGPAVARIDLVDGRVTLLDRAGEPRLTSPVPFAVDAHGAVRAATVTLVDRVLSVDVDLHDLAFPVTIDPAWILVGSLSTARLNHVAFRVPSGKVVVAGGSGPIGSVVLSTSEVYDPTSATWSAGPVMPGKRTKAAGVTLASGKVLIAGGNDGVADVSTSAIYDPTTNAFSAGPAMAGPRSSPSAALLPSGKVLVVGGFDTVPPSTAELYDPATNKFSAAASMSSGRSDPEVVSLASGKVLVIGGYNGAHLSTAEVYDPATNTWTGAGALLGGARYSFSAERLPSGKVMVVGGSIAATSTPTPTTEIYDPVTNKWTAGPSLAAKRLYTTLVVMSGAKLLAVGGYDPGVHLSTAEVYDPTTNLWSSAKAMVKGRTRPSATLLDAGKVLLAGGYDETSSFVARSETFEMAANGKACDEALQCVSGLCVDGVCCNTACTGQCQACDVAGSVGTCTAVTGAPHGTRTACAGGYVCVSGACATTCTTDVACPSTTFCSGGKCVAKKTNGAACAEARECTSGNCVDGVCCTTSCTGQCESCSLAGKVGTCSIVTGAPVGGRPACAGVGVGTTCGNTCTGTSGTACGYPAKSVPCGAAGCKAGIETHASYCDGAGKCGDVAKACGAYACDATACKTSCATKSDCAVGFYCDASACVPIAGLGEPCATAASCPSGFCVDGVCCAEACPAGKACNTAAKKGLCYGVDGSKCKDDLECGSGHCVDGVCCNTTCTQGCEACDVTGKEGTCVPVTGPPHGARPACADGGGDLCKAKACDGKDPTGCYAFAGGASAVCAPASCEGEMWTPPSTCNGTGACAPSMARSCAPYVCEGTACRTDCTTDSQCARGFGCVGGACVSAGAKCTADRSAVEEVSGRQTSCSPLLCRDGRCLTTCASTSDCAAGYLCDGTTCRPQPPAEGDSSGCSTHGASGGPSPLWLCALILCGALRRAKGGS